MAQRRFTRNALALISTALAVIAAPPADASITHEVAFRADPLVIVWTGSSADIGEQIDFRRETNFAPPPRAGEDAIVTGALVAPGSSPANLWPVGEATPWRSGRQASETNFYVASNTAFAIDAHLVDAPAMDPADVSFAMSVTRRGPDFGAAAQTPHAAGPRGGFASGVDTLADLAVQSRVFTGHRRTAVRPGSIRDQSVRFDVAYTLNDTGKHCGCSRRIEVSYTVFVP